LAIKLFARGAYRACRNCAHGRLLNDGGHVVCVHRGVVDADSSCRRYSYDPLKRVPRRPPKLPKLSDDDFRL
jgi:hypothetical protein